MKSRSTNRLAAAAGLAACLLAAPAFAADAPKAAAPPPSPIAEGRALFEKKCVTCHTLERSLAKKADRKGWDATVASMIRKGATLTNPEGAQVAGYLAAKSVFETKCNTCHDLDRPLTAIKSPEQWKATVLRMAGMKPGVVTDEEAGAITLYLSLVTPVKK